MSEELIEIAEIESNTEENAEATEQTPERAIVFEEALEAILFAAGHPVSYATLARVFDITPSKIKDMVANYSMKYNSKSDLDRGVILLTYSDSCQLCTKELYLPEIRDA
jgi:chromosome segregation and condensation protein ScpB